MAKYKWKIDPKHSEIMFKVKHLMISSISGFFKKYELHFTTEEEDFKTADNIVFKAEVKSIETFNQDRNEHLISEDFFDAEEHRLVKFVGEKIEVKGNNAILTGNLTIRNVTKPVHLNVEFGGIVTDPNKQRRAGFVVTGQVNRQDYFLHWNGVLEAGTIVVSDEIHIHCNIQVMRED